MLKAFICFVMGYFCGIIRWKDLINIWIIFFSYTQKKLGKGGENDSVSSEKFDRGAEWLRLSRDENPK